MGDQLISEEMPEHSAKNRDEQETRVRGTMMKLLGRAGTYFMHPKIQYAAA